MRICPTLSENPKASARLRRSEEHTSELQSHLNLVCRLLLEKKNIHSILMTPSVNAANHVVSLCGVIAVDDDSKFFAYLVRCQSSSVPSTGATAYDVCDLSSV